MELNITHLLDKVCVLKDENVNTNNNNYHVYAYILNGLMDTYTVFNIMKLMI